MGPESLLSEAGRSQDTNPLNPPKFVTGVTSKMAYRDTLRRWIRMISGCAEVNNKYKAFLRSAGHMIYMACDDMTKEMLKQSEKSDMLDLDGDASDSIGKALIETIIGIIAKDTPNEAVIREVQFLSDIQTCERGNSIPVPTFVNRYKGSIARYVNQTAEFNEFANRQFAIIMMRNAKLSSHTINAITFQLTTNANSDKQARANVEITLTENEANRIT